MLPFLNAFVFTELLAEQHIVIVVVQARLLHASPPASRARKKNS